MGTDIDWHGNNSFNIIFGYSIIERRTKNVMADWYSYPYNYSDGSSVNSFGDYMHWAFITSNNTLSYGFLIIIWLATFVFSLSIGARKGVAVASFITFIMSVYLVRLDAIHIAVPIALIFITIVGVLLGKDEGGSL